MDFLSGRVRIYRNYIVYCLISDSYHKPDITIINTGNVNIVRPQQTSVSCLHQIMHGHCMLPPSLKKVNYFEPL